MSAISEFVLQQCIELHKLWVLCMPEKYSSRLDFGVYQDRLLQELVHSFCTLKGREYAKAYTNKAMNGVGAAARIESLRSRLSVAANLKAEERANKKAKS
eukprot:14161-Heterococcus_DN1.PRE.3